MDKDIIILGGGPGGYVAAIKAAQLGAKVCIIEKDKIGGTCLNKGCIPTKALYRNAEIINTLKNVKDYGISVDGYSINVDKIHERKQGVVDQLIKGIKQLIKLNNIEVVRGQGELKDKNTVLVTLESGCVTHITASSIIIATGSKPIIPSIKGADLEGIYTSDTIINFKNIPKSLNIIGGGVIGMEFACIFNALGTVVTVIEAMPNILPMVDTDLTKRLLPLLKKKGMDIYTSTNVVKIEKAGEDYSICCEGKKGKTILDSKAVLLSVGRSPVTDSLNLEALQCKFDKKGIKVDENYQTNIKGVYAIGDVNGKVMLAHAASHQGIRVAEHIMGIEKGANNEVIPNCVFTFPEIASVGITEDEARQKSLDYKVSRFPFGANGKSLTLGECDGMVKVISSRHQEKNSEEILLGVHIMGPHASDLIHEAALAVSSNMKVKDIANIIHAHPTLSEAFLEAVKGLKGEAIHMSNIKKQNEKGS